MSNDIIKLGVLAAAGFVGYKVYQKYKNGDLDQLLKDLELDNYIKTDSGKTAEEPSGTPHPAAFWNIVIGELRKIIPAVTNHK